MYNIKVDMIFMLNSSTVSIFWKKKYINYELVSGIFIEIGRFIDHALIVQRKY